MLSLIGMTNPSRLYSDTGCILISATSCYFVALRMAHARIPCMLLAYTVSWGGPQYIIKINPLVIIIHSTVTNFRGLGLDEINSYFDLQFYRKRE